MLAHRRRHVAHDIERIVREVVAYFGTDVGIAVHLHDDAGTGVANALAGVRRRSVQGTINGYGEHEGNCNLTTIIPNLTLKWGSRRHATVWSGSRRRPPRGRAREHGAQPAGGLRRRIGVAHKAGLHVSDHQTPGRVRARPARLRGQRPRFMVSGWPGGRRSCSSRGARLGRQTQVNDVVDTLKQMEHEGYHFEAAGTSLSCSCAEPAAGLSPWFEVESFRVITDDLNPRSLRAASPPRRHSRCTAASGSSPPPGQRTRGALDSALRSARRAPALDRVHLTDYKWRPDTAKGTGAVTSCRLHERRSRGPRSA